MSKTLAEQLVEVLPEDWEAEAKNEQLIYRRSYDTFVWDTDTDSPDIVNWALGELAKKCFGVCLESCGDGTWRVRYVMQHEGKEHITGLKTSKTLALAYALVEVTRG